MFGIIILAFTVIGLSYHVHEVAPERGRSAGMWIALTVSAGCLGCILGIALLAGIVASDASAIAAIILNPVVLGCVAAIGVVVALHRIPVAAVELSGDEWEFDRLDSSERVRVAVSATVRIRAGGAELVLEPEQIQGVRVDGECVVLDLDGEKLPERITLLPVGLASRAVRRSFAEAIRARIQRYVID